MRQFVISALIGVLTALLLPALAAAQIGESGLPLDIEADHVEIFDADRRIVWQGNVAASQGDSSIRADEIVVYYSNTDTENPSGNWGDIERIEAIANVIYRTPDQIARGDRGIYELASETIILTGEVIITQGENVIATNRFVTNLASGNSSFGIEGDGQRVRAQLAPADETPADDDDGE